jgi:hypothetical protein
MSGFIAAGLAGLALTALPMCGATPQPASPPARVIVGELETGPIDISPPTRLDVNLWNGRLAGQSALERCDDMGGVHVISATWGDVCQGVDY